MIIVDMDKFNNIALTIFIAFITLTVIGVICKNLIKFLERTIKKENTNLLDILRIILNIDVIVIFILFFICWFSFLIFVDYNVIKQQKEYSIFIIIFSIPFYLAGIYGVIKFLFKKRTNYC